MNINALAEAHKEIARLRAELTANVLARDEFELLRAQRDEAVKLARVLRLDAQRLSEWCCSLDGDATFDAVRCYQETSSDVFAFLARIDGGV